MRKANSEEIRSIQIKILDFFAKLCEENNINYFLTYGTLLGAIRHKGFIPWDDDVDVAMLREDYEKLISLYKTMNGCKYQFICVENNSACMYPFGKIIDTDTILYERGIKTGIYIDIFVYDNAPIDIAKRNKAFDKLDFYSHWRQYQLSMSQKPLSFKRICVLILRWIIYILLPRQYFTKRIVQSAKKYREKESNIVCSFTEPYLRWVVEKSLFTDLIYVEFEGKKYKAPRNYEKWLTIQYGDWRKIPSIEEQKLAHHNIIAYIKK